MKRWLLVIVAALSATALAACGKSRGDAFKFQNAEVTKGPIQAKITASGTLSPLVTVQVGSQVSGRIAELHADFNSTVHKGDVVARIDPLLFQAQVEQNRAQLAIAKGNTTKARAQLTDAQRQADRQSKLATEHLVAQSDADTAAANLEVAKATVDAAVGAEQQAVASLHQAELNLTYTTILSPIDGTVISRSVDVGQTVAASMQAPTLFTIAQDLRKMQVDTNVAEADVGRLQAGMKTTFTVDAYPSKIFQGTIREVRNAPQTVQNVVTYDAVIDVNNPDLELKPGMTANVTVVYADRSDAVRVPNAALRFRPPPEMAKAPPAPARPDERTVWVDNDPKEQPKPQVIHVGVSDGNNTELIDGQVSAGDKLVTDATSNAKGGPGRFGRVF